MKNNQKNAMVVELYDLSITERKDDRYGRVVSPGSMNEDDLIRMAVERRTDLSPHTLKAALEILKELAHEQILNGTTVSFGLSHYSAVVNGVFLGDHDSWDPSRHKLSLRIEPSADLREDLQSVDVVLRGPATTGPVINTVTDKNTGLMNSIITPGGIVYLEGKRLMITGDAPEIGLRLRSVQDQAVINIPITAIFDNYPSKLGILLPVEIPAGKYIIELCTQYSKSHKQSKKAQTYTFPVPVEVKF